MKSSPRKQMEVFEYPNVSINAFIITADRLQTQQIHIPIYNLDRFTSIQQKIARKLGIPISQVYVHIESDGLILKPFTYVIDAMYMSEKDQVVVTEQTPASFAAQVQGQKQKRSTQVGPLSIPQVFIEAHQRRPFDDWKDIAHHNMNGRILQNMIKNKQAVIRAQVLALSQEVNLEVIPKYLQRVELRMPIICGFILLFFPHLYIPYAQSNQQETLNIEQSLITQFISKRADEKDKRKDAYVSRFYIKEIRVSHSAAQLLDLQVMFNSIKLAHLELDYMQYYHTRGSQQFVATKIPIANPQQELIQYQFIEPRLRLVGKNWALDVEHDGSFTYHGFIKSSRQEFIGQEALDVVLEELEKVIAALNGIEDQFSTKPIFIDSRYLKFQVVADQYISNNAVLPINISTSMKEFMGSHSDIIHFEESYKNYKCSMFSDEVFNFKVHNYNEYVIYEYNGVYNEHLWIFPLLLCELVTVKHLDAQSSHYSERGVHQKQDPVLFNNLINTYSRSCQAQKKPLPVSRDGPFTYKFWNYTTEREQLYRCNEKFPYLYFMSGLHKLNYCVPCCTDKPPESKNKRGLYKRCQEQHVIVKEKQQTSYILQNSEQFQLYRYTVLDLLIAKHIQSHKAYVMTVTVPEYYQSQRQSVHSLIKGICFALKVSEEKLLQHVSEDHLEQLRLLENDVDLDLWVEYISHIVLRVLNTQIVIVDAQTYEFSSVVFTDMCLFLLRVKSVFNPIRIDRQYRVPNYQFKQMPQMERHIKQQQQHHPLNVFDLMTQLGAKDIKQLATIHGYSRYLIGKHKEGFLVLPTFPAFTDQIPETRELPDLDQINPDYDFIKQVMTRTCRQIQYRVNDENNELTGYIADDLFYPCLNQELSMQGDQMLPIYQVKVNPFKLNSALLAYQEQMNHNLSLRSKVSRAITKKESPLDKRQLYMSVYTNYLYDLLAMQNPAAEDDIEYMELPDLIDLLEKQSGDPEQLRKLMSCKRQPSQFFCKGNRLLLPQGYKHLVRLFIREKKLQKNYKVLISQLIADTEFQNDASEILKIERKSQ